MINNPKIMKEILEKIKNIPDEVILKAIEKVEQEWEKWEKEDEVEKDV